MTLYIHIGHTLQSQSPKVKVSFFGGEYPVIPTTNWIIWQGGPLLTFGKHIYLYFFTVKSLNVKKDSWYDHGCRSFENLLHGACLSPCSDVRVLNRTLLWEDYNSKDVQRYILRSGLIYSSSRLKSEGCQCQICHLYLFKVLFLYLFVRYVKQWSQHVVCHTNFSCHVSHKWWPTIISLNMEPRR